MSLFVKSLDILEISLFIWKLKILEELYTSGHLSLLQTYDHSVQSPLTSLNSESDCSSDKRRLSSISIAFFRDHPVVYLPVIILEQLTEIWLTCWER
jgi:hypothetical protein